jgi:hypothetical protein
MVGGDADMALALLEQVHHRAEHADDGTEGPVLAFRETAQAMKVAEQLVGSVDEVNDQLIPTWNTLETSAPILLDRAIAWPRASTSERLPCRRTPTREGGAFRQAAAVRTLTVWLTARTAPRVFRPWTCVRLP